MRTLADAGVSQSDIARRIDISLRTVQRWTGAGVFPERTQRSYPHSVDAFAGYLNERLQQGCRNVSQLWWELRVRGYCGQLSSVWSWLQKHRGHTNSVVTRVASRPRLRTSPRHTAWLMLKEPPSARAYLEELYRASPELAELAHLSREFFRIVHNRDLTTWLSGLKLQSPRPYVDSLPVF